jgi:hypothetical protein
MMLGAKYYFYDFSNEPPILKKYELLFDGMLSDWKTKPVSFQLKECVSPYHGQAFLVPKIHKDTLIKEVERL